jgi:hypothetical protein
MHAHAQTAAKALELEAERLPPIERLRYWLLADAPAWLISAIFHMIVLLVLGLVLGREIADRMLGDGDAPVYLSAQRDPEPTETLKLEPMIDIKAPIEPTVLDPALLLVKGVPGSKDGDVDADSVEVEGVDLPSGGVPEVSNKALIGGLGAPAFGKGAGPVIHGPGGAEPSQGPGGPSVMYTTGKRRRGPKGDGVTPATERAVAAGLVWLARHQNADGSWSINHTHSKKCIDGTCTGAGQSESRAGATALGVLPFLGAGVTQVDQFKDPSGRRLPYHLTVRNALRWLVAHQKENGDLSGGEHTMYAHGLATIALCEAYGMTYDPAVGRAAQQAVQFIQSGQNDRGSWRYQHGTADGDTSVFGWEIMALKSAQMAGLSVDPERLQRGRKWLSLVAAAGDGTSQSGGQFAYTPGARPTPCMSAVGLLITQYLGAPRSDPTLTGGVQYLMTNLPRVEDRNIYYWYYAAQVMHNMSGPDWDTWNRNTRRILIETQCQSGCAAGSWDPHAPTRDAWGAQGGRLMVTSLSCLTLEVYYRYLPLYRLNKTDTKEGVL